MMLLNNFKSIIKKKVDVDIIQPALQKFHQYFPLYVFLNKKKKIVWCYFPENNLFFKQHI